jgi:flagellin
MSFSINTNITSLQAQAYLNNSAAFQGKTINKVTSGLRIINSGDDAAGLAVANGLRSSQAVLTQGISNANTGLATLQTIDGGINNISTLLDRASTLAAQSASGTFSGDRNVLNSEFQSVITEINRQAQSIGLDTGGMFNKELSVFIGGGQANKGVNAIADGCVNLDLSKSAVDSQALGLNGMMATGVAGADISDGGPTTVTNILAANGTNIPGSATTFVFTGPGFSDGGKQVLKVDLDGVTDTASLLTAINAALAKATTSNTGASTGTPFANAGITASITTDATGGQQLSFGSATAAFQVQAGDVTANALLGNFDRSNPIIATGQSLTSTVLGRPVTSAVVGAATVLPTTSPCTLTFSGGTLTAPITINLPAGSTLNSLTDVTSANLTNRADAEALAAAGFTFSGGTAGAPITVMGPGNFTVTSAGDPGLGFATGGTQTLDVPSTTPIVLRVQGTGLSSPVDFSLPAGQTAAQAATILSDTSTANGAALAAAGITVTFDTTSQSLVFSSLSGGSINVSASGDVTNALGFGSFGPSTGSLAFDTTSVTAPNTPNPASSLTNGQTFQISIAGGTPIYLNTGTLTALQAATSKSAGDQAVLGLNASIAASATLTAAGIQASADVNGVITFTSSNGTAFRVNATNLDATGNPGTVAGDFGFGAGVAPSTGSLSDTLVTDSRIDSAGASQTKTFVFNPTADQTISFSTNDATGATHTTHIDLKNQITPGSTHNAQTIDEAIASINQQLQHTGDATLQQIVAVKDVIVGGTPANPIVTEGIKFMSSLSGFTVSLGSVGTLSEPQGIGQAADQAGTIQSSKGSKADIGTQGAAQDAVTALANAVSLLGVAQAAVGKGENNLNYAVALATSQNTSQAAAESDIRDANLAAEAANLSRAQILVQAGTAALAQANSAPQAILSLLK